MSLWTNRAAKTLTSGTHTSANITHTQYSPSLIFKCNLCVQLWGQEESELYHLCSVQTQIHTRAGPPSMCNALEFCVALYTHGVYRCHHFAAPINPLSFIHSHQTHISSEGQAVCRKSEHQAEHLHCRIYGAPFLCNIGKYK